ncbi:MAG: flagellar P-ring protein FlgI [Thermosipho sp. (in: thermotogales)]|jgi:flagellar P-ring protein precursor FlgI|nr:flagellar P-ring protein FlgI [Thermosipho sp. (in: thermotogales)]MDK2885976.1 flagellar P-ring protein FlgI [Thermosipho sp. (in: thermotogales)]
MKKALVLLIITIFLITISFGIVRIKDIATFRGARDNQLFGMGIVVGLNGMGDDGYSYSPTILNMLEKYGSSIPKDDLKSTNTALVMVLADIPAYYKVGMKIDVYLYAVGNAKNIENGFLLSTDLYGADNIIYAKAEGQVLSFNTENSRFNVNGKIQNGGTIIKDFPKVDFNPDTLTITLKPVEFLDTIAVSDAINKKFDENIAEVYDKEAIKLKIPEVFKNDLIGFLSVIEEIEVIPSQVPIIVIKKNNLEILYGGLEKVKAITYMTGNYEINVSNNSTVLDLVNALKKVGMSTENILDVLLYFNSLGVIDAKIVVLE